MSPLDLANRYMEIFYSGKDLERMYEILSDDLEFSGPFYQFINSQDYVQSLMEYPPNEMSYEILHSFEGGSTACLIYKFMKPGISIPMAQTFDIRNGKIKKILLIFDSRVFA